MGAALSSAQAYYDEPREVAAKLSQQPSGALIAFLSPQCGLCSSLRPALEEVAASTSLEVAYVDAQRDRKWAPEMLRYDVEAVPCLVLLGPDGRALCKTAAPRSRQQMEAALQALLQRSRGGGSSSGKPG